MLFFLPLFLDVYSKKSLVGIVTVNVKKKSHPSMIMGVPGASLYQGQSHVNTTLSPGALVCMMSRVSWGSEGWKMSPKLRFRAEGVAQSSKIQIFGLPGLKKQLTGETGETGSEVTAKGKQGKPVVEPGEGKGQPYF